MRFRIPHCRIRSECGLSVCRRRLPSTEDIDRRGKTFLIEEEKNVFVLHR